MAYKLYLSHYFQCEYNSDCRCGNQPMACFYINRTFSCQIFDIEEPADTIP